MKRSILVLVLTLGLLSLALLDTSGGGYIKADSQNNQSDKSKAESSRQEAEKPIFDIDGKRFRADEQFVAQRKLRNGSVIAYRKNRREVAALVKALKEDGVTDKELLNPNTWLMVLCHQIPDGKCINGGCGTGKYCRAYSWDIPSPDRSVSTLADAAAYCRCAPLSN